jgi:hypothetical protein
MVAGMLKHFTLSTILVGCLAGAAAADDPMTVTTDTPEYCLSLAEHMRAKGDMPQHALMLWQRGRAMCLQGHIRSGLARLRRANLVMHGAAE